MIRLYVGSILRHDPRLLLFVIGVCAVAATVASFQYAVFTSFLRAGAAGPRALGGDVWIVARGVDCFDFPTRFSEDYAGIFAPFLPQARVRRVSFGFAEYRSPSGRRGNVAVIGVDGEPTGPVGFIADTSDLARLDLASTGQLATIGGATVPLRATTDRLRTFLGAPYVITGFEDGRAVLGLGASDTSFLVATLPHGLPPDWDAVRARAAVRYPEVELLTTAEFATRSSRYWQRKTGAGAAILLAAILAALLMLVLMGSGIGRFVQRYEQDLLSLVGHGAHRGDLWRIIAVVAALIGAASLAIALLVTPLLALLAQPILPWVSVTATDLWVPLALALAGVGASVAVASKSLDRFAADAVFRT